MINLKKLIKSFQYALEGIIAVFQREQNFRIELILLVVVIIMAVVFPLSLTEKLLAIWAMAMVLVLEMLNTVLEYLVDIHSQQRSEKLKFLKDAMAGAVLLVAIVATIVEIAIFIRFFGGE